jgi:hypothetical protein
MKRIQEKVKDLIEIRPYSVLGDYFADPAATVAGYHFTDATSELMAKWLDVVAGCDSQVGAPKALAGYRGVGKSHFLAVLGAITSHPELRSKVLNAHVAASAQRLKRKKYPVAFVKRGTGPSLLEELQTALADTFELGGEGGPSGLEDLLEVCIQKNQDIPLVILVDTAREREGRVARDDGKLLGELADLIKNKSVVIGVALDDDIAGADGANAAIARNYSIDYLDQEHLYRVVETHLFPKHRQSVTVLHDIYTDLREVLPSFRWSEQRFQSLFPLHPVIMEVAPFIRLYAKDFALLGFASEAGQKAQGRPGNSLVGLDEVFDKVEGSLRRSDELKESFEAFDRINNEVIGKIPIMERLQAKLVLKALMLLSLDGEGTTASEICAAMLIYNEGEPQKPLQSVQGILEEFASALPDGIRKTAEEGREARYSLRSSTKDNLNGVLAELSANVPDSVVEGVLRRFARERFPDWITYDEGNGQPIPTSDSQLVWRGGYRRGKLVWADNSTASAESEPKHGSLSDWEVSVVPKGDGIAAAPNEVPTAFWVMSALKKDEIDAIKRYYVLLTNNSIKEDFAEQIRAAGHAHKSAIRKIWHRAFLQEAVFLIDGKEYAISDQTQASESVSELLTALLPPLFESRYPEHPRFASNLGMHEVSRLVGEHFSGQKQMLPEVQDIAEAYALPLGLVVEHDTGYILDPDEKLIERPLLKEVMNLFSEGSNDPIPLKNVYAALGKEPYGLVKEAQHIVLAALVALRHLEFVTAKGDRINRRSLDLKIIWDDIVAITRPSATAGEGTELVKWANLIVSGSIAQPEGEADADSVTDMLAAWLKKWKVRGLLEKFEALPDDVLNTRIWRLATNAHRTFGSVAQTVEAVTDRSLALNEGLRRIADVFSDSEESVLACKKDLDLLANFIEGYGRRESIWQYLALCDPTGHDETELLRDRLIGTLEAVIEDPTDDAIERMETDWKAFRAKYAEQFGIKHDAVMRSHLALEKLDNIVESDNWWQFRRLSESPVFYKNNWYEAQRLMGRARELGCNFDVKESLKHAPFCACSFRVPESEAWENLPAKIEHVIEKGIDNYFQTLALLEGNLCAKLEQLSGDVDQDSVASLTKKIKTKVYSDGFTNEELKVLLGLLNSLDPSMAIEADVCPESGIFSREELRSAMTNAVNILPGEPLLLKV